MDEKKLLNSILALISMSIISYKFKNVLSIEGEKQF